MRATMATTAAWTPPSGRTPPPGATSAADLGAPGATGVVIRMLGSFSVTAGGLTAGPWPRPSARRVCALVLVSPGRRLTRDAACEDLFPGLTPRAAARSLSKALSMARAALAPLGSQAAALLAANAIHIWAAADAWVDADAQAAALQAALRLPAGAARDQALATALADEEELLADEPYADWALRPRDQLEMLRQEARLTLARDRSSGAAPSGPGLAAGAWRSVFEHDLACEEAAGALIDHYLAAGRRELAARVYWRCSMALDELGLRVSPALGDRFAAMARR
jgi:DNA-binding SARP family transcriptional activator